MFLTVAMVGCNLTDFTLPVVGGSNDSTVITPSRSLKSATIEEICDVAMKNEARARDTYAYKYTVTAQGEFQYDSILDLPYVIVKTDKSKKYDIHVHINKNSVNWKQYDNNQIASTGVVTVSSISYKEGWGNQKATCIIQDESSDIYRKRFNDSYNIYKNK